MGILLALGLPSGFLWRDTIPFTNKSYQFFHSSSSECSTSSFSLYFSRPLGLCPCRENGRGRLGYCVHMLQLWSCSHLSVISRDQLMAFMDRNRIRANVFLDLSFSHDTDGWLRYLCSLSPTDCTWKVKWGITRRQGQTHCVALLGIPLVGI